MSEALEVLATVLLIILIPLLAIAGVANVIGVQEDNAASIRAFCQSIEGSYGGGKCYKDGVEIKVEK